jgi:hypothetical protein
MTKAFICVLLNEGRDVHSAGANANVVAPFSEHGLSMSSWLQSDLLRSAEMIDKIRQGDFDAPTLNFITQFASFVENAPPATEEKDYFIGVTRERCDILRTSPEVAEATWRKVSRLGK